MKAREGLEIKERMLKYFREYSDTAGAPSVAKFIRDIGISLSAFDKLCTKRDFNEALRECKEFRRDYLIDCGLTKRFDASFVKFLLQSEEESPDSGDDGTPMICFEVINEKTDN